MMKHKKATYLFDEIGNIDDRLVQEAMLYRAGRASPRVLLVAACIAMSLLLVLGTFAVSMMSRKSEDSDAPQGGSPMQDHTQRVEALDEMLVSSRDSISYTTVELQSELDFYDGNAYVVWQYADSAAFCVSRALTATEAHALIRSAEDGTDVGTDAPDLQCRVWILLGDGTVISPYLKSSAGNVGIGTLFDYDPELIPSQSFTSRLSDILN